MSEPHDPRRHEAWITYGGTVDRRTGRRLREAEILQACGLPPTPRWFRLIELLLGRPTTISM